MTTNLDELRALEAAATPGPISVTERGGMGFDLDPVWPGVRGMFDRREDAEFYAAARNALPGLLEENARLRAESEKLRGDLQWHKEEDAKDTAYQHELLGGCLKEREALLSLVAATKHAWERLGQCEEEFEQDAPSACVEWRDALDGALVRLFQAVCEHGESENGFCVACGVKVE